jgi:signal transduction histidine kinase
MPNYTGNWLFKLSRLGIQGTYEDDVSRRIVFANVIFITLPVVYLIFMVIDYESFLIPINEMRFDQWVVPLVMIICVVGLWLNKLGFTTISRLLFVGLWPFLLHLIPIKLLNTPVDYILAFPFGIVFHAILIQLMFSHKKEWAFFWGFMLINFLGMIFFPNILAYMDTDHDIPLEIINHRYISFDGILYWLLFNLVTFYIMYVIESYIQRLNDSRLYIEDQKEELNSLNQNLEEEVSRRTAELKEQNEKLKRVAFFNAHELRGPFCRIQGLIYLQQLSGSSSDKSKIKLKLEENIGELGVRIREMQKLVDNEEED